MPSGAPSLSWQVFGAVSLILGAAGLVADSEKGSKEAGVEAAVSHVGVHLIAPWMSLLFAWLCKCLFGAV